MSYIIRFNSVSLVGYLLLVSRRTHAHQVRGHRQKSARIGQHQRQLHIGISLTVLRTALFY